MRLTYTGFGVFGDGNPVADHERIWAKHQTLSLPEHLAAAKALRSARVGLLRPAPGHDVAIRALGDYDDSLGLSDTPTAGGGVP